MHIYPEQDKVNYSIDSNKDLSVVIVHLGKHPLYTNKAADFFLFKQVVKLMNNKAHLTVQDINQIVNIKASMNLGLSDKLKSEFPNNASVARPIIIS